MGNRKPIWNGLNKFACRRVSTKPQYRECTASEALNNQLAMHEVVFYI